jgi:hypothetical protein
MGFLVDQAENLVNQERIDPPPDKNWFNVQIKRFEKGRERFDYMAKDNKDSPDLRQDALRASEYMQGAIDEWYQKYGHLTNS